MDILVIVEGQKMKLAANQSHHIEGSNQFVKFHFDLSDEWLGLSQTVQFIQNGKAYGQLLDGTGNDKYAFLPNGIVEGDCKMVLWGSDGTVRATTNYIQLSIGKDISTANTLSENINRTDYETALADLKKYVASGGVTETALNKAFSDAVNEIVTTDNIKNQLASGISTAKEGIDSAKSAIESAKTDMESAVSEAKGYAVSAKTSSDNASTTFEEVKFLKADVDTALESATTAVTKAEAALSTANDAVTARNEIVGSSGTATTPSKGSALYQIREARELILGEDGIVPQVTALKNEAVAARDTTAGYKKEAEASKTAAEASKNAAEQAKNSVTTSKESVDTAYKEIFGEGGSLANLQDGALKEVRETKDAVSEFNKTGGSLEQAKQAAQSAADSAELASEKRDTAVQMAAFAQNSQEAAAESEANVKAVESKIDQANESANKIETLRTEMTTSHNETVQARNDILQDGSDGKSVYDKVIEANENIGNAKTQIIGSSSSASAESPDDNSALAKVLDAAKRAEDAAESANHGITIENNLSSESTTNALSAHQGKVLNDGKLDKTGGTMTGDLTLNGAPTTDNMAANKKYVDDNVSKEATENSAGRMSATDKAKLNGIENNANNYSHPTSHPATMITEDLSHRFVSDVEKNTWNSKADGGHNHDSSYLKLSGGTLAGDLTLKGDPTSDNMAATKKYVDDHTPVINEATASQNGLMSSSDKAKLDGIEEGANKYVLPVASAVSIGGIKVGENLSITEDGVLSADAQQITIDTDITENSENPVSGSAVYGRLGSLKFVVSSQEPTVDNSNIITLVLRGD